MFANFDSQYPGLIDQIKRRNEIFIGLCMWHDMYNKCKRGQKYRNLPLVNGIVAIECSLTPSGQKCIHYDSLDGSNYRHENKNQYLLGYSEVCECVCSSV